jgi:hypothetical protein
MSPVVRPFVQSKITFAASPQRRRAGFGTVTGSKAPFRSRGTRRSTSPTSVLTVLGDDPLREFPDTRPTERGAHSPDDPRTRPPTRSGSPAGPTRSTSHRHRSAPPPRVRAMSSLAQSRIDASSGMPRPADTAVSSAVRFATMVTFLPGPRPSVADPQITPLTQSC